MFLPKINKPSAYVRVQSNSEDGNNNNQNSSPTSPPRKYVRTRGGRAVRKGLHRGPQTRGGSASSTSSK